MKFIIALLLFLALPVVAWAAVNPTASLSVTGNRRYVNLSFANLRNVSRVSYVLTYDSGIRQRGFEGGFYTKRFTSRINRRQILGTCSSGKCVFHANPKNLVLEVTFYLRTGGTLTTTKTLL